MRKKFLVVLLTVVGALCLCFGLTACDDDTHVHSFENYVYNNDATCTEDGTETAKCTGCAAKNTREKPYTALGHDMQFLASTATCIQAGEVEHWHCDRCGLDFADQAGEQRLRSLQKSKLGHEMKFCASTATCIEAGEVAHWHCDRCGLDFANQAGTTQLENLEEKEHGHQFTAENKCKWYDVCGTAWDYTDGLQYSELYGGSYAVTGIGDASGDVVIPYGYQGKPVTSIRSFEGCTELTSIVIPASVTSIGSSAFEGCTGLESITVASGNETYYSQGNCLIEAKTKKLISGCKNSVIPDDVTSIGNYAFYNCTGLTGELNIPEGVTSIGNYAFYNCTGLTGELNIPEGVTVIGHRAFEGCTGLTSIVLPASVTSIGDSAFYGCTGLTGELNIPEGVTSIGDSAFYGCTGLTGELNIPEGVTVIGHRAFEGCTGLTSIALPASVTSIGSSAFYGCTGLESVCVAEGNENYCSQDGILYSKSDKQNNKLSISLVPRLLKGDVVIPDGVTSIGSAFEGCIGLTSIVIPDSVTGIGYDAFGGCTGLKSVAIGNGVTSIGEYAFSKCTGLKSVTIGNGVTTIGKEAFYNCTELKSVTIGSGVTTIEDGAFAYCYNLSEVHITDIAAWCRIDFNEEGFPANPLYYGHHLYKDGAEIKELVIPAGVTEIGQRAFYNCTGLTNVVFSEGVTSIGEYAFYGCTGLTSVVIPSGVTTIGQWAFRGCAGMTKLTIGKDVTLIGNQAFTDCYKLVEVWNYSQLNVQKGAFTNGSAGYYAINVYKTNTKSKQTITSDGFIFLENNLLGYAGKETALRLPNTSPSGQSYAISQFAFYHCSELTSIFIPAGVTAIEDWAFTDCNGLQEVQIADLAAWYSIDFGRFDANPLVYARHLYKDGREIKELVISAGASKIADRAFCGCDGLTSLTIESGAIGESAFAGCRGLKSVTMGLGVTSIEYDAFGGCSELESVTIGVSVTYIENFAFGDCTALTSVVMPSDNWKVMSNFVSPPINKALAAGDLQNASVAARYLTDTYVGCNWTRGY